MPIYRNGNDFSDTDNGGVSLGQAIERLVPKKRGKGRLPPAPEREALGPSTAEAVPIGDDLQTGTGWISPIVQQKYTGATYYTEVSSDGLWTWEFGHEVTLIDDDGNGDTYVLKLDDPNTPPP